MTAVQEAVPVVEGADAAVGRAPLVSVIVATNRGGPFLDEALGSVLQQAYRPIELIVVDDGAPDSAAVDRAAAIWPDVRILHQEPAGVSIARNRGVAQSHGELIVFLDDDDRWHPDRLRRQVEDLAAYPGAVAGYCSMRSIDAAGSVLVEPDQIAVTGAVEVARRRTGIMLPNLVIRRDAFDSVGGFHTAIRQAEDLDLVLKLSLLGDFVFTKDLLVDYRTHAGNTTRRHRELCRSIDQVVRLHLWSAREQGRDGLATAHRESLRANGRFAWWGAARAAKSRIRKGDLCAGIAELAWAQRFAPAGVPDAVVRRLRGKR